MAVLPIDNRVVIPIGARALAEGMAASAQRMWESEPRLDGVLAELEPESRRLVYSYEHRPA